MKTLEKYFENVRSVFLIKNKTQFFYIYTVSGKKRPPKQNAVKCTVYNTIQ